MNEAEIIQKVKGNDEQAFEELVSSYKNMMYSIINRYSLRYEYIKLPKDDLFQEACISLFEACRQYDPSKKTKFSTFAYRVIYCRLGKEILKIVKVIQNEVYMYDEAEYIDRMMLVRDSEFTYSVQYARRNFFESVSYLSNEDQTILKMRLDNYSYKEIADKLNITPKRVDNRLNRLRRKWKNGIINKY